MVKEFVEAFERGEDWVREQLSKIDYCGYTDIVKITVSAIHDNFGERYAPSPDYITVVDYGDYQGTMVFVIGEDTYQPSRHWYLVTGYGSCSGCDELQAIFDYSDKEERLEELMGVARRFAQEMRPMWPLTVEQ